MSKASLVLMPQTYGPFYTSVLKKWAIHLVKKADLAFSRDTQSAQEMHELGVGNLVVATDLKKFIESPEWRNINWKLNFWMDNITGEKTKIWDADGLKEKARDRKSVV